ncbi:MAG: TolC family protein [Bacteroidetes Order II. Incertae sedis bacterium]|jgi:outer membrane protein TolC|nr:TolC family protein [Bacteroidetes Order II. bacterium]MBT6201922.1 TolC family protein [Bacteroidetes Order II. bacterium]MBT6599057.1 TolC family protein [Bacteroidetes Order II. bacterium]
MKTFFTRLLFSLTIALLAMGTLGMLNEAAAQETKKRVSLTMEEAIQIALVENLALQNVRLDMDNANAQIKEGWAELYPKLDINASYTRNVRSANPFAGSDAGGLFETLGFINWLSFNEQARTDADAGTEPISINEYFLRQQQGYQNAGIVFESSDNPFSVPNMYMSGLSITQKLFDGRVIYGAYGASKWLKPFNEMAISRQEQKLVDQVKTGWYASLLLKEQVHVLTQSVQRAKRTLHEVSRQVTQGVSPKFQRLSAEVEVANLETQFVQAETAAAGAVDNLKLLLGIPADYVVDILDHLESDLDASFMGVSTAEAMITALDRRPDLRQATIGVELEKIQLQVAKSEFLPTVDAFANINYIGNVPDNRTVVRSNSDDPFSFTSSERDYFDSSYWDRSVNVGLRLSWNIFNGFASRQRVQQRKISMQKSKNDTEFLTQAIRVEVESALRGVRSAHTRMLNQQKNVDRAELNFKYAEARLKEGVATPLEVRSASDQLDQSRLGYLQAVHDFLVARSAYETAMGMSDSGIN